MWTLPTQEEPIQVPENNQADDEPKQWEITRYIRGWLTYYRYADMKTFIISANKWYNRRLRMYIWKRWKRIRTRLANLQKCGIPKRQAWQWANTRKGYWRISKSQRTADIGRVSVNPESLHQIASQLREPPYAERHVRWCERSENESRKKTTSFSSYSILMTAAVPTPRTPFRPGGGPHRPPCR